MFSVVNPVYLKIAIFLPGRWGANPLNSSFFFLYILHILYILVKINIVKRFNGGGEEARKTEVGEASLKERFMM